MILETLRPKAKPTVYELLDELGIDVSAWQSPSNPKYCYEWAFIDPGKLVVLCLWFDDLILKDGRVCETRNLKKVDATLSGPKDAVRRRRMRTFENAVSVAVDQNLPIRVILCLGSRHFVAQPDRPASHVTKRSLDPATWHVERYDSETGEFMVVRGDAPTSSDARVRPQTNFDPRDVRFVEGVIYSRRDDVHEPFGGSRQGGISVSAQVPAIFVFTGEEGEQYGYQDAWDEQGCVYTYTGEGQVGDMQMARGNAAIANHLREGRTLHLFSKVSRTGGMYRYLGEMQCAGAVYSMGPDREGNDRQIIKFQLVRLRAIDAPDLTKGGSSKSLENLRAAAYKQSAEASSNTIATLRTVYERSRDVALYVLRRAHGVCECCGSHAPFLRNDNSPYLEVHHIDRVSDGGLDLPDRVAAVCPTCHRRIHFGADGTDRNNGLRAKISKLEEGLS